MISCYSTVCGHDSSCKLAEVSAETGSHLVHLVATTGWCDDVFSTFSVRTIGVERSFADDNI